MDMCGRAGPHAVRNFVRVAAHPAPARRSRAPAAGTVPRCLHCTAPSASTWTPGGRSSAARTGRCMHRPRRGWRHDVWNLRVAQQPSVPQTGTVAAAAAKLKQQLAARGCRARPLRCGSCCKIIVISSRSGTICSTICCRKRQQLLHPPTQLQTPVLAAQQQQQQQVQQQVQQQQQQVQQQVQQQAQQQVQQHPATAITRSWSAGCSLIASSAANGRKQRTIVCDDSADDDSDAPSDGADGADLERRRIRSPPMMTTTTMTTRRRRSGKRRRRKRRRRRKET